MIVTEVYKIEKEYDIPIKFRENSSRPRHGLTLLSDISEESVDVLSDI